MYNQYFTPDKTQTLEDINATIDLLYITQCRATKNALLNRLRRLLVQYTMVPNTNFDGNVIPAGTPMGMESGMSAGIPQGMPQGMPQMPSGMPQQIPQTMPQSMPQIPQSMPQGMPQQKQGMPGAMPPRAPQTVPHPQMPPPAHANVQNQRTFTAEELSRYDGKGDNPAYVAVNGIVYDVTDQPGWAAGSHFGLKAGLDQTSAYISCHTGQPMIDRLKVIGRFVK